MKPVTKSEYEEAKIRIKAYQNAKKQLVKNIDEASAIIQEHQCVIDSYETENSTK